MEGLVDGIQTVTSLLSCDHVTMCPSPGTPDKAKHDEGKNMKVTVSLVCGLAMQNLKGDMCCMWRVDEALSR